MTIVEWSVEGPILDEPPTPPNRERTAKVLEHYQSVKHRTDQHGRDVIEFQLFQPRFGWKLESVLHVTEIFKEGYSADSKDSVRLGPYVGSCSSSIMLNQNDRIQAFSVTLPPTDNMTKEYIYYELLSRGVPSKLTLQQYSGGGFTDFNGQFLIRSEDCDVHPDVFTKWIDELTRWYRRQSNGETRERYSPVESGRS
jgi:hypothetical protein